MNNFFAIKEVVRKDLYEKVWAKISEYYKLKAKVYLKAFVTRRKNRQILYESETIAMQRESVKSIKTI